MKCPVCGSDDSRVLDSRPADEGNSIKRRRECNGCGRRFNTYEVIETTPITVVKKDGSREFFDRHKLLFGITRACYKRPVDVESIVNAIENDLNTSLVSEITTHALGDLVMDKLRCTDAVSYVRFASVYRDFKDVDVFLAELQEAVRRTKPSAE